MKMESNYKLKKNLLKNVCVVILTTWLKLKILVMKTF